MVIAMHNKGDRKMSKLERTVQFIIYFFGIIVMSFGIVLTIKADIGVAPWDVLHIGLYKQFGLTIGTWNIIVGIFILAISSIIMKKWPQFGAYLNMIFVGLFIDVFMIIPIEPSVIVYKLLILISGIFLLAVGMGIYISAQFGTGPRDSLMMALHVKKGWKVANVRLIMEVSVLIVGWLLGGPVHVGTIIISLFIGHISGLTIPYFYKKTELLRELIRTRQEKNNEMVM